VLRAICQRSDELEQYSKHTSATIDWLTKVLPEIQARKRRSGRGPIDGGLVDWAVAVAAIFESITGKQAFTYTVRDGFPVGGLWIDFLTACATPLGIRVSENTWVTVTKKAKARRESAVK